MQYYFLKNSSKNLNLDLRKSKLFIFLLLFAFLSAPVSSWAFSPLDTTLVIEKDIYPKIVDKQERLIEGKKYAFATINERKGMIALSGNFLSEMARAAGIEVTDFLDWNDMKPTDAIKTGQVYYLQEKGNRAKDVAIHVLMDKETLWDVSQKYAMRYKYLLKYNRLDEDDKVKVGRVLWIQTKRPKRIPVEVRDVTPIVASFDEEEEDQTAADPELMAEWEELKKTELAGMDNKDKTTTTKTQTEKNNSTETTNPEQGSFAEFEGKKTDGVIITEKTDAKKNSENTATTVIKYHTVAEAQSLYDISKKYNVVMSKLKEWNKLPDYTVSTGQKLIVSQPNSTAKDKVYEASLVTEKKDTKNASNSDTKVVVRKNANGEFVSFLDSSGVLLPIPQQDFTPVAPTTITNNATVGNADYHFVEQDETLWSIARKYNLSPKDLIRWNGFITGDNIDVGDKIILKSSLAVEAGSRSELENNNSGSTNSGGGTNQATGGDSEFKEATLIDPAVSNGVNQSSSSSSESKTNASTITLQEFLQMGGEEKDFKNVGKEGYDPLGMPILGYDFSKNKDDETKTKVVETETQADIYVVQPKDMLGKIAQKFSVTTKEMMLWNPKIPANGTVNIGDTLFVSQPKKIKTVIEETVKEQKATVYPIEYYGAGFHAVQPNENVYNLSEKYGVPVANIWKWNNLETSVIDLPVGKKMIVNEGVLKMANVDANTSTKKEDKNNDATAKVDYNYHYVAKGETLFSIAQKYNLSTAQIREWNNRQGDLVYENEKLIIGIK
ncbi:LysM peptidoglycan-binding domain-containing protein [Bernardetia sp. ABR2-2B]|uniref:muramidase family protein n=1 Tax=Bernardetia sp. ABR2-2B TaxID=3127472 RepID=UPI0030CF63F0